MSFKRERVIKALRRMSYEGDYPTNKGGLDQLNQTQTSTMVVLVNNWDYNYSAFIFDNMKKMLENPKKKLFILYPRFIQMILDAKYPELVKSANLLNLKPMGPGCFATVNNNLDTAKKYQFTRRIMLEKHGKFGPVIPAPKKKEPILRRNINLQLMSVAAKTEVEAEVLVTEEEEGINDDSDVEMIVPKKVKEPIRDLTLMTAENLEALMASLHHSLGNPPSVTITSQEK
ncbi:hypothetical protein Hanom_Chr06g00540061 [Helianthus anomalus]